MRRSGRLVLIVLGLAAASALINIATNTINGGEIAGVRVSSSMAAGALIILVVVMTILGVLQARSSAEAPVLKSVLPHLPSKFIGRDADLRRIEALVRRSWWRRLLRRGSKRLVSLSGMPGVGKSALIAVPALWDSNIRSAALTCTFLRQGASDLSSRSVVATGG